MLILLAAGGSVALLAGALAFQYIGGMLPCVLCIWQRWPHGLAVLAGAAGLMLPGRLWPLLGALGAAGSAAVAGFHSGVELSWWEGLEACSGGSSLTGLSGTDLLNPGLNIAPVVRCDVPTELFLSLTMANWNGLLSLALAGLWLAALRART